VSISQFGCALDPYNTLKHIEADYVRLDGRVLFGRHIFLFDGGDTARLAEIGELHRPSIADLFVALMGEEYENSGRTEEAA
ncbi:MAG TPA: hypothetical protein VK972_10505, partial [Wenzhouxiangella sp.]|nr:hypothetical protein [Wenzhouxiangella sp.]